MAEVLIFVIGLAAFEFAAARFARSTRDGEDWVVHDQGPHMVVNA